MLAIESRGVVFDATREPPESRVACFTALCPLNGGEILCGFQNGPRKHAPSSTIRLCRSSDEGRSWELLPWRFASSICGTAGSLAAAEMVEAAPGRVLLVATWFDRSDPDRPLFDPVTEGILRSKQLLCVSNDGGSTWGAWRELDVAGLKGCALTGPVQRWRDGTIAVAFESFKEYDDPESGRHAAWVVVSRDGGETFSRPMLVAQHPDHTVYYWDQRLCAGSVPGCFTAMFWTHDLAAQRDLNVHLRHARIVGETMEGEAVRSTSIPGQIAAPTPWKDNQLLAFVVDRGVPATMALWRSRDGGATWPVSERLVVYAHDERAALSQGREEIDFKQYWEDMGKWSFGHPAIRPLRDGCLLAWYAGTPDCMSVHWARVREVE